MSLALLALPGLSLPAAAADDAATAPLAVTQSADTAAPAPASAAPAPVPAAAPAAAAAPTAAPVKALETVVVTAQKRKEDVKLVPMSITAISGDALTDNQIVNVGDLTRNVPNVSFTSQAGPGLSTIEIRGISSQAGSATVGVYLDDVSLTTRNLYSQGTAEPRFFDVQRVEVLRGPQGTLYGAGSMGGTIRYISNAPDTREFTGEVRTELSNTDHGGTNSLLQAVLNVPLKDDVAGLRLGVQTGHDSGYIDQVDPTSLKVISNGINGVDWNVLKGALKLNFNHDWSLTPAVFYQRTHSADIDAAYLTVGGYQAANAGAPLNVFQTSKIVREPGEDILSIPSLTLNGDLGFADFTGVLSDYERHFTRTQDGTSVNSSYIGSSSVLSASALAALPNLQYLPSAVLLDNKISQQSVELRLASKLPDLKTSRLAWVGGVYFDKTKTDVTDLEPIYGINAAFQNAGLDINSASSFATNPDGSSVSFPGAFVGDNSYYSARHYNDKQSSIFGEGTYYWTEHLRLTAGLRYLEGSEDFSREGNYYFAGGPVSQPPSTIKSSKTTPKLAINYDLDPETTVYGSVTEGFRLGGYNRAIPLTIGGNVSDLAALGLKAAPAGFGPDSLWSYELGSKSRLLDNRVNLNMAVYYIDWKDIQQDVNLPTAGFDFETNAGRATSSGAEFDLRAQVADSLILNASAGYTHAVFAGEVPGLTTIHKGTLVPGVPKYNFKTGGDYLFRIADQYDSVLRLNIQATGSSHGVLPPAPGRSNPDYERPAYVTMDASWSVTFGKWDFGVNVKNLTNNSVIIQQPSVQFINDAYYLRPRTIGITLTGAL